jgi:uncharacterized protein (DUF58 family)
VRLPLVWTASRTRNRLASVVLLATLAAGLSGRGEVLAVAVPALWWLALGRGRPTVEDLDVDVVTDRSILREDEAVEVSVTAPTPAGVVVRVDVDAPDVVERRPADTTGVAGRLVSLRPSQWGRRRPGRVEASCTSPDLLWSATATAPLPDLLVRPAVERLPVTATAGARLGSYGTRVGRRSGAGLDFLSVDRAVPGEPVRRVHWPTTSRTGALHVTTFAAEQRQDVIVAVDATVDLGVPPNSTVDRVVRAAASLAEAHSAAGDRVGVVTVTPELRWLAPGTGRRHLLRCEDLLGRVREPAGAVPPDLRRVPRAALPPGALVLAVSPLRDERFLSVVADVRRRGHPVVLVDVQEPAVAKGRSVSRAERLRRIEREATVAGLRARGVLVVPWPAGSPLAGALLPLRRPAPLAAGARP